MKYLSLFSGIGGFELGIKQAHESNNEHAHISKESEQEERSQGRLRTADQHEVQLHNRDGTTPLCIGYSEIDKYATQIYQKHFPFKECEQCKSSRQSGKPEQVEGVRYIPNIARNEPDEQRAKNNCKCEHKNYGDITKINPETLPDFDFLCGGFPCQAFSIAGKRLGFNDTRGTLFFDIARVIREKQPRFFLLENVKGLLSHDNGRTFKTIISTLTELGYDLQWQVLNSKNFGVPQNRERVFIIGHLRGTSRPQVFPIRKTDQSSYKTKEFQQQVANTLRTNYSNGHSNETYIALTERRTEEAKRLRRLGIVKDTRNLKKLSPREDGLANTVTTGDVKNASLTDGFKIRRLTPTECERLQGFPDGWTEGVSDTQRYKQLGNAVTVNVVEEIIKRLSFN